MKWHKDICRELETEEVFQLIAAYADYYFAIYKQDLSTIDSSIRNPLKEFRRILSDMPAPLLMELYRLYKLESISGPQLAEMLTIVNSYLQRRALCDLDTSSISRLFPALLRDILVECDGDFTNIVEVLKKNLIVKNAGNSMYMPNDVQLAELIDNANMYNIHATRLFLDKLEHHNNNAPVDLNSLSIEHIMPQTPTSEWYQALNIDEDTYQRNVHRLGNLTLASKRDNSAMGNGVWAYKNAILADTAHLKINEELLKIAKWTIAEIDNRTKHLIEKIKQLYPYPNVSPDVISRVQVYIRKNNVQAKGFLSMDNGSVEVEVGSQLRRIENAELYAEVEDLRQELLEEGVIAQTEDGLSFIKPYIFYSKATNHTALSPTASLIMHGSQNGWEEWVDSSGTPLCNIKEIRSMFS